MINLLTLLPSLFGTVKEVIDNVHTSDEERLRVEQKLFEVQTNLTIQVMEYEKELAKSRSEIIKAEAMGQSWIQRNWRPIAMLTFLVLVVLDSFGLLAFRLSDEAWLLLQIGLGGYVVGRSAEKIAPKLTEMRKQHD